jgi:putative Holliday junction resolvase
MGAPGRVVAVDLGEVRVGVAVSDSARRVASPFEVLRRSGDVTADRAAIGRIVEELGATTLVVGVPVRLDGTRGQAADAALEELALLRDELGARLGIQVVGVDERLSTVEAQRRRVEVLRARDAVRRGGRGGRARPRRVAGRARGRPILDDLAAAVLLQAFLDASPRP